jgi:2-keto-4-pentenoate hydratase/2-oxohepta-3-ene-1,7-dioic acid hydratase in catechol pathway
VLGRRVKNLDLAAAEQAIGGFVCVNDVTCRDLQQADGQWGRAKGFDSFCPVGPAIRDGLDWNSLALVTRVNGVERQRANSAEMVFSIPYLISFLSRIMTLEAGDLIATGTPAGTAPLKDGDVVEVEISGVGVLSNPVRGER